MIIHVCNALLLLPALLVSCRPVDVPIRPARIVKVVQVMETDSTALQDIAQASIINDSTLAIRGATPDVIVLVSTKAQNEQRVFRFDSDDFELAVRQLPDELPELWSRVLGRATKVEYDLFRQRYLDGSDGFFQPSSFYGALDGYDVIHLDTLVLKSKIRYPYTGVSETGENETGFHTFPILVVVSLRSLERKTVMLATGDEIINCVSNEGTICYRNGHLWIPGQDLYYRELREELKLDLPSGSISARFTLDGQLAGAVSREDRTADEEKRYVRSQQYLCDGVDSLSMVRVLSYKPAVDLVDTDDGSFRRVSLPESIVQMADSGAVVVSDPVRYGNNKLALRCSVKTGIVQRTFIVVGTLLDNRRDVKWHNVVEVGKVDQLMSLVDTNDSPLYRKDLLGIFENPDTGPYLARIELE
ncbi:MAG: hypothetical protein FGM32_10725 [Candidatus Kapabacteria bacterium]|nr:hypothetical protein [Candidatus Kapabacteria bacterium]